MKSQFVQGALRVRSIASMVEDSASDVSSDWGPGYDDLTDAQKKILEGLKSQASAKDIELKKEQDRKFYNQSIKLMNNKILTKWNNHINKSRAKSNLNPG